MILVNNLSKDYTFRGKNTKALNNVSFSAESGIICGLLGSNGAGKSTMLNILSGRDVKFEGKISVSGADLKTESRQIRRIIGYVTQGGCLSSLLTVRDELLFTATTYGLNRHAIKDRIEELAQAFNIGHLLSKSSSHMSGGEKRKFEIILALLTSPKILILDEPSTGLDPQSRLNLSSVVKQINQDYNITVLISTHYLAELEFLCDKILVLDAGELIAEIPGVKSNSVLTTFTCKYEPLSAEGAFNRVQCIFAETGYSPKITRRDGVLIVTVQLTEPESSIPKAIRILNDNSLTVLSLNQAQNNLSQIYSDIIKAEVI